MSCEIRFTRHVSLKFDALRHHGFEVTQAEVEQVVLDPDSVWPQEGERWIAQKAITGRHVLRVVYRREPGAVVIITFYPGRKERYESAV
ncbi:MAG: DUF4258 domain-containing protein [Anaerolineae bacterium]|nr:DUF4258 domain-containing protein [Anaerolineae bacterium]